MGEKNLRLLGFLEKIDWILRLSLNMINDDEGKVVVNNLLCELEKIRRDFFFDS